MKKFTLILLAVLFQYVLCAQSYTINTDSNTPTVNTEAVLVAENSSTAEITNSGTAIVQPLTDYSSYTAGANNNANAPLSIEMVTFEVTSLNTSINLNWSTASETNSKEFEILRSTNAVDFETIAIVDAAGSSNNIRNYIYTDLNVLADITYYYKLKQVDFDGKYVYTNIKSGKISDDADMIVTAAPNPTRNGVTIITNIDEIINVSIYNLSGNLILHKENISNKERIDLSNQSAGIYTARIYSNTKLYKHIKIIKQ